MKDELMKKIIMEQNVAIIIDSIKIVYSLVQVILIGLKFGGKIISGWLIILIPTWIYISLFFLLLFLNLFFKCLKKQKQK